jgi:chromosome partitioning protein
MKITAFGNKKGGVGKTTLTLATAAELAHRGHKVLVVDLDSQMSASQAICAEDDTGPTIYDLLTQRATWGQVVAPTVWDGVEVLRGDRGVMNLERETATVVGRLRRAVAENAGGYDHVLIDLPPSSGMLTLIGLRAAERVVVVTIPEPMSESGLADYLDLLSEVRGEINTDLTLTGIVMNQYDQRQSVHRQGYANLRESVDAVMLDPVPERTAFIRIGVGARLHEMKSQSATEAREAISLLADRL